MFSLIRLLVLKYTKASFNKQHWSHSVNSSHITSHTEVWLVRINTALRNLKWVFTISFCHYLQEFLTSNIRFQLELSSTELQRQLVGGRCVSCHTYSHNCRQGDDGEDSKYIHYTTMTVQSRSTQSTWPQRTRTCLFPLRSRWAGRGEAGSLF